jgi:nickel/cobalt transporter (NicO) family protein
MRRLPTLLLALVLLVPILGAPAEANPLLGERAERIERAEPSEVRGPLAAIGRAMVTFQREANRRIGEHMRAIRDGTGSGTLLIGLALAFAYGVVHAAGPGHGKMVVVSYFLAREARIGRGLLMGAQIAFFHVLSAIVLVVFADFLLRRAFGGPPAEVAEVRIAAYGLIVLIGGAMLVQAVRRSLGRASRDCGCAHASHGQQGLLALGVGLVPCTGSMLILLYALANDLLLQGLMLVAMIALGMALTMGLLGLLSVVARGFVAARVEGRGGGAMRLHTVLDYAGALMITSLGVALLATAT